MKSFKTLTIILSLAVFSFIGFTACNSTSSNGTGTLKVSMTDAPGDFEEVNVSIQSVRVHKDLDAETSEEETNEEAEEDGWITILEDPITVNLLNLRNGNEIPLGEVDLEAGTYSQMRFVLGENNTVVKNGQTFDLMTPSAQQSGLKLNINADIEDGQTYSLLVDFDAGQSVVETGATNMFILKPVLHAVNLDIAGTITGVVEPSDFETAVMATTSDDTLTTVTEQDGSFTIAALAPGTYDLTFQPDSDQYQDSTQTDLEVTSGDTTDVGTVSLEQN